jgi:hypothetical protein
MKPWRRPRPKRGYSASKEEEEEEEEEKEEEGLYILEDKSPVELF